MNYINNKSKKKVWAIRWSGNNLDEIRTIAPAATYDQRTDRVSFQSWPGVLSVIGIGCWLLKDEEGRLTWEADLHLHYIPLGPEGEGRIDEPARQKPPLGLKPRRFHDETRVAEIINAIERYAAALTPIPSEWFEELNENLFRLNARKSILLSDPQTTPTPPP